MQGTLVLHHGIQLISHTIIITSKPTVEAHNTQQRISPR
jgi:hypothetical protein